MLCVVIEKYLSKQHAETRRQEAREAFTRWLTEKKQQELLHREEEELQQPRDEWRSETNQLEHSTHTHTRAHTHTHTHTPLVSPSMDAQLCDECDSFLKCVDNSG